ncbi:glycerophosphodiester phosphodiesterase [Bacillaceae bacterium SIJ1]|uniref:glycerophosphodiester phosphodiesterase n=1 Tax=Litoribacterium kuwaitense TaxID=1398745 RepID=UPI0013EB7CE1|nr:glycerophosphodiester phosphodiesterase family protein [Litoribacterium kuwaitense]NGP45248.1 glycerophosphodiester phosphodiesterase [Litoribacterium kuwaitense]
MKIKALAHRGYPTKYAENTLSAYRAAFDLDFEYVEIDVHLSKDGVPILMHDITVDRMTNGQGFIKDFTYAELQALTVGSDEKIPTLKEGLIFCKNRMKVAVELKQQGDRYPGLEEAVLKEITDAGMLDQVYVNSFDHFAIMKMRELSNDIELGIIQTGATPAVFPFMKEINATYLSVRIEFLTDEYVQKCRNEGVQIVVWPVDADWQFEIFSRHPDILCTTNDLAKFKEMYVRWTSALKEQSL